MCFWRTMNIRVDRIMSALKHHGASRMAISRGFTASMLDVARSASRGRWRGDEPYREKRIGCKPKLQKPRAGSILDHVRLCSCRRRRVRLHDLESAGERLGASRNVQQILHKILVESSCRSAAAPRSAEINSASDTSSATTLYILHHSHEVASYKPVTALRRTR